MEASIKFVEKYYTDDLAEANSPESIWVAQWFKYVSGSTILDVACGPQLYNDALAFAQIPKELTGIDINATNIEFLKTSKNSNIIKAKKALEENGTKIELILHDIRIKKPELEGQFDSVFASGIIGNFNKTETRLVLQNLYSYLKPEGSFVMVSWGNDYLSEEKFNERNSYNWYQRHELRPEDYGNLIEESGFSIKKQEVYTVLNPREYEWGIIFAFVATKNKDRV